VAFIFTINSDHRTTVIKLIGDPATLPALEIALADS
jgi:hypothetical protein